MQVARGAVSLAGRTAMGLARAMGVDTDPGSVARKNVELETTAVNLSNQGFQPGAQGANGRRQDPKVLAAEMRSLAADTGVESGTTL